MSRKLLTGVALTALMAVSASHYSYAADITVAQVATVDINDDSTIQANVTAATGLNFNTAGVDGDPITVDIYSGVTISSTSVGVESNDSYNEVINHGTIAGTSYGIQANGTSNMSIDNYGSISAPSGEGIHVGNSNSSITNRAGATISGSTLGVHLSGSDQTLTNYGTISSTTNGVVIAGSGATITNSGTISGSTNAINYSTGGATLNINDGAVFTGGVNYNNTTGNTTNFNTSGSYSLDVKNYITASNTATATNGKSIVYSLSSGTGKINVVQANSVESSTKATANYGQAVATVMDNILDIDVDRSVPSADIGLSEGEAPKMVQLAPGVSVLGSNMFWVRPFAGQQFFNTPDTTSTNFGIASGIDHQFAGNNRFGALIGYGDMSNEANDGTNDISSTVMFTGAYLRHPFAKYTLDSQIIAGTVKSKSERSVNGTEKAIGHFDGWFITPSVSLSTDYQVFTDWVMTPSVELRYTVVGSDGYTEEGSSQNVTYDNRLAQRLEEVLGLELSHTKPLQNGNMGTISFLGEVVNNTNIGGSNDVDASVSGTDFIISSSEKDNVIGARVGVGGQLALNHSMSLYSNAKVGLYSDDSRSWSANVGLKINF